MFLKTLAKLLAQHLIPVLVDELKELLTKHKDDVKESNTDTRKVG